MKHLDEFRDPKAAKALIRQIQQVASRPWVLMDVCGGQTHGLVRYGIEQELRGHVELVHGPGCPVCVTSASLIDLAVALSHRPRTTLTSFGDMLRVPGMKDSLLNARSRGGRIQLVYSPLDAVALAQQHPEQEFVFFAVGFETTAPATAVAVLQAHDLGLQNFSIVPAHVRVLPAMETIMNMPNNRVQGFLAAGHVCSITGYEVYQPFVRRQRVPVVVTGFEPIDLLKGILRTVLLLEASQAIVENCYGRSVQPLGNTQAQELLNQVYEIEDRDWRGFGTIASGGYRLKANFRAWDATEKFADLIPNEACSDLGCRAAEVMSGQINPKQCAAFGSTCTPETPLGPPMVSSEGACAAYHRFDPILMNDP